MDKSQQEILLGLTAALVIADVLHMGLRSHAVIDGRTMVAYEQARTILGLFDEMPTKKQPKR